MIADAAPDVAASPDAADARDPNICTKALDPVCAAPTSLGACVPDWETARLAERWCTSADSFVSATLHGPCNGYDHVFVGDGFGGRTYFYDAATGKLVAVGQRGDVASQRGCAGGPDGFRIPADCQPADVDTLCDPTMPRDAGRDAPSKG